MGQCHQPQPQVPQDVVEPVTPPPAMADGCNCSLANEINNMPGMPGNAAPLLPPPAARTPVYDPFTSDQPFYHINHTGAAAFESSALNDTWDGTPEPFPSFMTAHCIGSSKACWGALALHGIVMVTGLNLLTGCNYITEAQAEVERVAYDDPCAIQNAKAM